MAGERAMLVVEVGVVGSGSSPIRVGMSTWKDTGRRMAVVVEGGVERVIHSGSGHGFVR